MIQRILRSNFQLQHIRNISGIQNLFSSANINKHDDEDISEDVINASQEISRDTKSEVNSKKVQELLAHVNLTHKFKHFLHCTDSEATKMINSHKRLIDADSGKISIMIEYLFDNEISIRTIINNPWLLTMDKEYLRKKLIRVKMLKPKNINDVVPLLQASHAALNRAVKIVEREKSFIAEGSRIYYLSEKLNLDPALVSKYLATHMFMFEISFEMLTDNLKIMLEYNVDSINIIRDFWAFKYYPKTIRDRLERCKQGGKENLKPWMIRCPEDVLENSLKLTQENNELFGTTNGIIDYLSERLGYDIQTIKSIVNRHPAVLKCRGAKVKEVLDYLLDEEKFEPVDIARVIRVLTHSLATTKKRLKELKAVGCRPSTLSIICRSQREYSKFLKEWMDRQDGFEYPTN
ncbi:transcription termination factor, mitochondrial [Chironomus tepperi]|uniref:transcription termination factor, mitochondrial n=1 Tax=Chironomus tepperi TaxID=113505 RepID=UPI00391F803F